MSLEEKLSYLETEIKKLKEGLRQILHELGEDESFTDLGKIEDICLKLLGESHEDKD